MRNHERLDPTQGLDGRRPVGAQPRGHEQRIDQDLGQVRGHAGHDGQAAGRGAELREHGHCDRQRFLAADEHHRAPHADRCAQGAGAFRVCVRICFPFTTTTGFPPQAKPANTVAQDAIRTLAIESLRAGHEAEAGEGVKCTLQGDPAATLRMRQARWRIAVQGARACVPSGPSPPSRKTETAPMLSAR